MRTTSASCGLPSASTIVAWKRTTCPLSVISRWISNQSRSSSAIDGSSLALPSPVKNASRPGNCALVSELYMIAEPSPATWRTTPNSSPRLPRRWFMRSSSSASLTSFASKVAESALLCASAASRSRVASASSAACFSLLARNSLSRAAFWFALVSRAVRVCSSSSSSDSTAEAGPAPRASRSASASSDPSLTTSHPWAPARAGSASPGRASCAPRRSPP